MVRESLESSKIQVLMDEAARQWKDAAAIQGGDAAKWAEVAVARGVTDNTPEGRAGFMGHVGMIWAASRMIGHIEFIEDLQPVILSSITGIEEQRVREVLLGISGTVFKSREDIQRRTKESRPGRRRF